MEQQTRLVVPDSIDYRKIRSLETTIRSLHHSPSTRMNYRSAWKAFRRWCETAQVAALPASTADVRDFITWCLCAGYRMETVIVRICAIRDYHRQAELPNPVDESLQAYIRQARRLAGRPRVGKDAITAAMVRQISIRLLHSEKPRVIRDRALVLLAFATGWRRSEVVGLEMSDLRFLPQGLTLWLRRSKVDQYGEGRLVGIHPGVHEQTCPILALRRWLEVRGTWDGPVFVRFDIAGQMTRKGLATDGARLYHVLKHYLEQIGCNPSHYGAHSLRSGMITEAAMNGASDAAIMQRTGHRSTDTLRRYIRPASVFQFNPLKGVL